MILTCVQKVNAQTTWVKTLNKDFWLHSALTIDSINVGPYEIAFAPNGTIVALVQTDPDHNIWLFVFDTLGNTISKRQVGHYAPSSREDCFGLQVTKDNQIVYLYAHLGTVGISRYEIVYGPSWTKHYDIPGIYLKWPENLIFTYYNTSYIQFPDSIVEVDSSGNNIRTKYPISGQVVALPDSDFILTNSTSIQKENFSGAQKWYIPQPGFSVSFANMSFIYARSQGQVMKINTIDGNIIWTKNINSRVLTKTSDYGFIILYGKDVSKYDSSGTVQWSKTFSFPEFGFKSICETNSKSFITGGCWRNIYLIQPIPAFSPFITSIDSSGKSILDSTNFFYVGNANDNYELSFGDDAVYVAAALGNTGLKRDTLLGAPFDEQNTYCTDWADGFASGINYKFSDFDGNGIIDTTDVKDLSFYLSPFSNHITPHWFRQSNKFDLPELRFSFENDSLNFSDTIKINVILGSPGLAVDSIYGLSFDMRLDIVDLGNNSISGYIVNPSSLGDPALNLYSYTVLRGQTGIPCHASMVLCRTDHANVYVAGDTIASFYFVIPSNAFFINPVYASVNWSAITEGGFPVALNVVSDTLYLSGTTGINKYDRNEIKIYPNPANDRIIFSFNSDKINELTIMDETGRKILSINNPGNKYILNVRDFADGIYYVSTLSSNKKSRSKFLVVH